jgi:plastocyanin
VTGRVRMGGTALAVVLLVGGCGGGEDRPGAASGSVSGTGTGSASGTAAGEHGGHGGEAKADFPRSEADTVVAATMRDYAFDGVPATVKGPKVFFEVANQGPRQHEFLVAHSDGKEAAEIEPFATGRTETLSAQLEPGSYKMRCLVKEGEKTHAELGMEATFTVE